MATYVNNASVVIFSIFVCFVLGVSSQDNYLQAGPERKTFKCYQCNVFRGSISLNECDNPGTEDDCEVCLKYVTKMTYNYGKPKYGGVHSQSEASVMSKVCVKRGSFDVDPGDFCRYTTGSKGYQYQCYCTGDLCNHAANLKTSIFVLLTVSLVAVLINHKLL